MLSILVLVYVCLSILVSFFSSYLHLYLSLSGVCVAAARLLGQACWSARPSRQIGQVFLCNSSIFFLCCALPCEDWFSDCSSWNFQSNKLFRSYLPCLSSWNLLLVWLTKWLLLYYYPTTPLLLSTALLSGSARVLLLLYYCSTTTQLLSTLLLLYYSLLYYYSTAILLSYYCPRLLYWTTTTLLATASYSYSY